MAVGLSMHNDGSKYHDSLHLLNIKKVWCPEKLVIGMSQKDAIKVRRVNLLELLLHITEDRNVTDIRVPEHTYENVRKIRKP